MTDKHLDEILTDDEPAVRAFGRLRAAGIHDLEHDWIEAELERGSTWEQISFALIVNFAWTHIMLARAAETEQQVAFEQTNWCERMADAIKTQLINAWEEQTTQ